MNTGDAARLLQRTGAPELRDRLRGLAPDQAEGMRRALRLLAGGDRLMAAQWLLMVSSEAPEHPEVLRWLAEGHAERGDWAAALADLARAARQRPDDFALLLPLSGAQERVGHGEQALLTLRAAARAAQDTADWLALSLESDRQGHYEDSLAAIEQVLQRDPASPIALLQRSRCHKALGNAEPAAADCRALIARGYEAARAWFSLVDLKTVRLTDAEVTQLAQAAVRPGVPFAERQLLDFALGKALEDAGRHDEALLAFHRANTAARPGHPWDEPGFARQVAAVREVFQALPAQAEPQGREVIFLVGLPRSGTTLVEQVLAAHSQVEGASELPYLHQVIDGESRRRGKPFPGWVAAATAADWTRLGREYLDLSARWRAQRPISTDKLPENWLYAGAVRAMLPQARIIDCRRDPVETCWSCYKQLFGPGRVGFAYSFETLGSYWREYDALCRFWAELHPQHVRAQQYEALVADPEGQIRALLAFCELPFEAGCLSFHSAQRAIRTPSALQVRQPMRVTSTPGQGYGAGLDGLRQALAPRA